MSKIILTRKKEAFNKSRPFKVFINGEDKGTIGYEQTLEYDLEPGTYIVHLKYNWMSSPQYTVNLLSGKNAYLSIGNGMKLIIPLYILMLTGLFFPFFLKIARVPLPEATSIIKIVLIFPALIYILVYLSVLKNRYIDISEDKSNPFS